MLIFLGILLLGLVYVWRKKDLDWIKPIAILPTINTAIPINAYQRINEEEYIPHKNKIADYHKQNQEIKPEEASLKPKFTPRFKKV